MNDKFEKTYEKLKWLTQKWWFYLLLLAIFFIPPFASKGLEEWKGMSGSIEVLAHVLEPYKPIMPFLHLIVILLVIALFIYGNRIGRIFTAFVGVNYLLIAFAQSITIMEKYGLVIITSNLILFLIIGFLWLWEVKDRKTDFTFYKQPLWKYWVVPLAILAFWCPTPNTPWNFNPIYLLTSDSPLAFCMMTPIYLAIFSLFYPRVNLPVLRITSFIGIIIGSTMMLTVPGIGGPLGSYLAFIHIPLLTISLYCFVLSFKKSKINEFKG